MARLSAAKPRLGSMPSRLGGAPRSEAERFQHRDKTQHWRSWYKTARWQRLRERVLRRDRYTCQATGVLLVGVYPAANSPVVDHVQPHRGDEAKFWDESNLQAVSKEYHDGEKQRLERRMRR